MTSSKGAPPSIGLIGVSGYATVYTDWLLEAHHRGKLKIVSLAALPSEQDLPIVATLKKLGVTVFDEYDALLSDDAPKLELCFIPTGIQWHARMAIAALKSGCNVLVEKPLAGSVEDVKKVQDTERETNRWVAVGFQDMYTQELNWLKQSLVDGAIGRLRSVSMLGAWPRPVQYYRRNHWAGRLWADDAQVLDSPLNNAFAHFVNLSLYLAGPDLHESADAKVTDANLYRAHAIENFDTAVVKARSSNDVELWFGVSHACTDTHEPLIRIEGENGYAEWRHEVSCSIHPTNGEPETRVVPKYDSTRNEMFESVLRKLVEPDTAICDSDIALRHTALIVDIHKSSSVQSVNPTQIDHVQLNGAGTYVPSIRGIEDMMIQAFKTKSTLPPIACQSASV